MKMTTTFKMKMMIVFDEDEDDPLTCGRIEDEDEDHLFGCDNNEDEDDDPLGCNIWQKMKILLSATH
ncbi:glutamic acid-rich protein-like [Cucumis melo var. makuwa]|uniref:Glutamic acid-rich protein-like n=1 Tax=Cucumis melo var. makuwa TaxID=1194695 RepID=A0A5D3CSQ6_CUCMM|nr:glutamic acid-rich protein-like [Cucumis melo var. makuwa]TYK14967.1 glutamic acid-rich protein-like [Cucumis melo var. makuwa]